jgi:hypothetical protein
MTVIALESVFGYAILEYPPANGRGGYIFGAGIGY